MSRRLVVAVGVLALVIVCVVIAVLVRTQPTATAPPSPSPTTTTKPTQSTLLVAVRNDVGEMAAAIVMGTESAPARGSWLSLQPGLDLDVSPEGKPTTLADEGPWAPADSARSVANELGSTVAGGFVMDRLAFAAMVDVVGGVTVNSATPIVKVSTDAAGERTTTTVVKAGKRLIFGPAAAEYVITLSPGESAPDRMARFDQVWRQVLLKLPGNVDRVRSVIGSLGSSSRISLSPEDISSILLDYQTALADRSVKRATAPATGVGAGEAEVYTLLATDTQSVVKDLFEPSILVPGQNGALPRVRVIAAGVPGEVAAQTKLVLASAGYSFVWGGQGASTTSSRVFVSNAESVKKVGEPIARSLGLPKSAIRVTPIEAAGVQATVYAGKDIFTHNSSVSASPASKTPPASPKK